MRPSRLLVVLVGALAVGLSSGAARAESTVPRITLADPDPADPILRPRADAPVAGITVRVTDPVHVPGARIYQIWVSNNGRNISGPNDPTPSLASWPTSSSLDPCTLTDPNDLPGTPIKLDFRVIYYDATGFHNVGEASNTATVTLGPDTKGPRLTIERPPSGKHVRPGDVVEIRMRAEEPT